MSLASTLKKSKTFIKKGQLLRNEISFNPNYFLTSWSNTIGYLNIKKFNKKNISIFEKYKIIFKEFFSINRDELKINYNGNDRNYENLILTYYFPKNLKKDGSYFDKYFSLNTKFDTKSTLWVLIPISENKTYSKNDQNILIINRDFKNFYKNILISLFYFLKNFIRSFFFRNLEMIDFNNTNFSKDLSNILVKLVKEKNIRNFLFPYEAQPHQHFITKELKRNNNKLKIIGYMHTVIPPVPLDYIKREGHPDLLLVNGIDQKNILCKKLGWKEKEVRNIVSLRYNIIDKINFKGNIFLPYFIEDENKMFYFFKKLINLKKNLFFPKLKVKNHPSMEGSYKHKNLKNKIEKYLTQNKILFKNRHSNRNISLFFGSTASVIECLERGSRAFHICSDPDLEKFDNYFWKRLNILKLDKNIFEYRLKEKDKIIKINKMINKNFQFKKLLTN